MPLLRAFKSYCEDQYQYRVLREEDRRTCLAIRANKDIIDLAIQNKDKSMVLQKDFDDFKSETQGIFNQINSTLPTIQQSIEAINNHLQNQIADFNSKIGEIHVSLSSLQQQIHGLHQHADGIHALNNDRYERIKKMINHVGIHLGGPVIPLVSLD